jgi:phenol hydroxylase P4 protein
MFRPDHNHHPDYANIDYAALAWTLDGKPWTPRLEASLRENGVTHMSYLSFRAPGLDGINGDGV